MPTQTPIISFDYNPFRMSPGPWHHQLVRHIRIDIFDARGIPVCHVPVTGFRNVRDAKLIEFAPAMCVALLLLRQGAKRVLAGDERGLAEIAAGHAAADDILAALEAVATQEAGQ